MMVCAVNTKTDAPTTIGGRSWGLSTTNKHTKRTRRIDIRCTVPYEVLLIRQTYISGN